MIKSERYSGFTFNLMLFGGLFFLFIAFIPVNNSLLSSTFCFITSLIFFYYLFFVDQIEIDNVKIEIRKKFRKQKTVILLKDILSWSEHTIDSRYSGFNFKILTIKTRDIVYKLDASNYNNYYLLRKCIVAHGVQEENGQQIYKYHRDKRKAVLFVISGISITIFTIYLVLPEQLDINSLILVYKTDGEMILCLGAFSILTIALGLWIYPRKSMLGNKE